MKIMKRFTAIMLMAVMFCQSTGCFVFAEVTQKTQTPNNLLERVDKYVVVNDEGLFEFKLPAANLNIVSSDEYQIVEQSIAATNRDIKFGKLILDSDGKTLHSSQNDAYADETNYFWWGTQFLFSKNQAYEAIHTFKQVNNSVIAGGSSLALALGTFGGPFGVQLGVLTEASVIFEAWLVGGIIEGMEYHNGRQNNGIILNYWRVVVGTTVYAR